MLKLFTGALLLLCLVGLFYAKTGIDIVIVAVIIVCAVFSVRGYSILNGQLIIHRWGLPKKFDLLKLKNVEFSSGVMKGSIRIWGIGGFFG